MRCPIIFCAALILTAICAAGEPKQFSFFGILPAKMSSYPACSDADADHICKAGTNGDVVFMELRPFKPKYLTSNIWVTTLKNMNAPSIFHARTGGAAVQEEVMEQLKVIYGKPTTLKQTIKQNTFGARLPSIEATWTIKEGYEVDFTGIADQIDEGSVDAYALH